LRRKGYCRHVAPRKSTPRAVFLEFLFEQPSLSASYTSIVRVSSLLLQAPDISGIQRAFTRFKLLMLLIAAAIATLATHPRLILFRTKFVKLDSQWSNLVIADAHKDLSALGHTYDHGVDWSYEEPICVMKGRVVSAKVLLDKGRWLNWFPAGFLDGHTIAVTNADTTAAHECTVSRNHLILGRKIPLQRVTVSLRTPTSGTSNQKFPKSWWPKIDEDVMSDLGVTWYDLPKYSIGSGGFQTGQNTGVNIFGGGHFPLIRPRTSSNGTPLKYVIDDMSLELEDVGFVSPEGWIVCRAKRGKQDGLAWLFPIPGKELKVVDKTSEHRPG